MTLDDSTKERLGVALNEATLFGVEVAPGQRVAAVAFSVLTLPEVGESPEDPRIQFLFAPVGRVVASLRLGRWDDPTAEVVPFEINDLLEVVESFEGCPIYGWEFFDRHDAELAKWGKRSSFDWRSGSGGMSHSISLFQEGDNRHLDLILWFDGFAVRDPEQNEIELEEFVAGGERWWDGFNNGDPRTGGSGMYRLKDEP